MLTLPPAVKLWACTQPVDFRKSFAGLALQVRSVMGMDPLSGHIFCFFNGRRDQLRLLFWDRSGYLLVGKKLERGSFKVPWEPQAQSSKPWELEAYELSLIMEGIELKGAKHRPRWTPMPKPNIPTKNVESFR